MSDVKIYNSKGTPFVLIILLTLVGYFGYSYYVKYKDAAEKRDAYSNNVYALQNELKVLKVNDSIKAAQVYALSLSESDYKRLYNDEIKRNNKLVKHIDELESITQVAATVTDTVYVKNEYVAERLKVKYENEWIAIDVQEREKDTKISYQYKLELDIINTVEQKRFLFFKYGVKTEKLTIYGRDPNLKLGNINYKRIMH